MGITMVEVAEFLQMTMVAFKEPLFYALTLMIAAAVIYNVKRIILE